MSTYIDRSMSLVERKKLQWAKEREELARISGYWRQSSEPKNYEGPFDRNRYASKFPMVQGSDFYGRNGKDPERRSSLPPLYKNQFNSNDRYDREREHGGETSGYGSDNSPEYPQIQSGYESSSSRDDRPKWGDKGVGVGKFWTPKDEPEKNPGEPPNWVKRGLKDGEIVVSNQSPAESPEQNEEQDRPYTTESNSSNNRSYIRGQNIPIDSMELAERERRRQIAIAHQQAIRQQLEERERIRQEERERRIKEEREEELRIEREQEIERQRQQMEQMKLQEKIENERKRKEAIQEAIELAQKEAQLNKMKQKMLKYTNNDDCEIINKNMCENVVDKEKVCESDRQEDNFNKDNQIDFKKTSCDNTVENIDAPLPVPVQPEVKEVLNNEIDISRASPKVVNMLKDNCEAKVQSPRQSNLLIDSNNQSNKVATPRADYQALVFQSPLEILQSIPYAVLVPSLNPSTPMSIAVPLMSTERATSTSRTENRILTPTQYRNKNSRLCDSSTQTEYSDFVVEPNEKYVREKFSNIELTYDNRNSRKCGRSRNEERRNEVAEERPKWGANRPPTRYLKQSEKDLLYQRKKLRQKMRDSKNYDDKNSSDESQMGSPRTYRKKGYIEKRNTRALWRKNDQVFQRNIRMYQTEIVPLENDKDRLYYRHDDHDCCCRCRCDRHNVKVDILKIEHNSPRESVQYKSEVLERNNKLPECVPNENSDIIEKLNSLHNGLMMKQEQWKNSPRTPSLSSLNKVN